MPSRAATSDWELVSVADFAATPTPLSPSVTSPAEAFASSAPPATWPDGFVELSHLTVEALHGLRLLARPAGDLLDGISYLTSGRIDLARARVEVRRCLREDAVCGHELLKETKDVGLGHERDVERDDLVEGDERIASLSPFIFFWSRLRMSSRYMA